MSGYGEASGNLVFKSNESFRAKIIKSDSINFETMSELFEIFKMDAYSAAT